MATNTTYLDQFVDKMYLVPNDVNRYLRLIRNLDKKAEQVQQSLNQLQSKFLSQLKEFKESSSNGTQMNGSTKKQSSNQQQQLPPNLKTQYEKIVNKQKQVYGYYKEKHEISQQLRVLVNGFYEELDTQLKTKLKQKSEEEKEQFLNRRKNGGKIQGNLQSGVVPPTGNIGKISLNPALNQKKQHLYDAKQPNYCYCERGSFGEMVMCQNPYCEREWFHLDCIEEKNLPEKWYCMECQKQKEKTRNVHSRSFFVNRES